MDIALHSENGSCVATWEIARRQNISKKYLEQILPQLRTGGFIKAQKGIRGGYTLACSPGYVTLADILNACMRTRVSKVGYHVIESRGDHPSFKPGYK